MKEIRILILLALLLFTLAACGGGGGSAPAPAAKTVTLKLSTTGTPSENLAGVGITIILPTGVTPALNSDGTVTAIVVTVTGVASPGTAPSVYNPASGAAKGKLVIAVTSSIVAGFGAGEYATVVLAAEAGTTLLQGDFALTNFRPIAVSNGADATGLTATISGYTLQ